MTAYRADGRYDSGGTWVNGMLNGGGRSCAPTWFGEYREQLERDIKRARARAVYAGLEAVSDQIQ